MSRKQEYVYWGSKKGNKNTTKIELFDLDEIDKKFRDKFDNLTRHLTNEKSKEKKFYEYAVRQILIERGYENLGKSDVITITQKNREKWEMSVQESEARTSSSFNFEGTAEAVGKLIGYGLAIAILFGMVSCWFNYSPGGKSYNKIQNKRDNQTIEKFLNKNCRKGTDGLTYCF